MARKIGYVTPLPEMGPIIRAGRIGRGWSQTRLGVEVGLHIGRRKGPLNQGYICHLEHSERCPSGRVARGLSELLEVEIPLPRRLESEHALGREAIRKRAREAAEAARRVGAMPRIVYTGPQPPTVTFGPRI